jgi:hypothetical protein
MTPRTSPTSERLTSSIGPTPDGDGCGGEVDPTEGRVTASLRIRGTPRLAFSAAMIARRRNSAYECPGDQWSAQDVTAPNSELVAAPDRLLDKGLSRAS